MKKMFALLAALTLIAGTFPTYAAEMNAPSNHLVSGDFEFVAETKDDTGTYKWPPSWTASGEGVPNVTCCLTEENMHAGKYAMCLKGEHHGNTTRVSAQATGLIVGLPYEITGYINTKGVDKGAEIYARSGKDYGRQYPQNSITVYNTSGKWEKISAKFVAENTATYIWLVKYGDGEVLFDDIAVYPCKDFAVNGNFSAGLWTDRTKPRLPGWEKSTLDMDKDITIMPTGGYEGDAYVQIRAKREDKALVQALATDEKTPYFKADKNYTLHFAAMAKQPTKALAKVAFVDADNMITGEETKEFTVQNGNWMTFSVPFTPPSGLSQVRVYLYGANNIMAYDGVRITAEDTEELYAKTEKTEGVANIKEPLPGEANLIENSDFEKVDADGVPVGFVAYNGFDGGYVSLSQNEPHSGKNCIRIAAAEVGKDPWIRFLVTDVTPGAEYQVSAFVRTIHALNDIGPHVKLEFYTGIGVVAGTGNGEYNSPSYIRAGETGNWIQVCSTTRIPEGTKSLGVYFRLDYMGEIYWDDVSFYKTAQPTEMTVESDQVFYYSDLKTGVFTAKPSLAAHDIPTGAYMDFFLKRNGEELDKMLHIPAEAETKYEFSVAKLAEKGQPYILEAQYKNADGTLIAAEEQEVFCYDRPSVLTKDGRYIKDGKTFTPVLAYHVFQYTKEHLDKIKETGANVVQIGGDVESTLELLDILQENGMMGYVTLYYDLMPAAAEENREQATAVVEATKNHPATLAYGVMDEPFVHFSVDEACSYLKDSYKLVRDIDTVHPIMMVESSSKRPYYRYNLMYCDAFVIDPYPRYESNMPTWPGINAKRAKDECQGAKPVYTLHQAYELEEYTPTPNAMLHMTYQHFMEGGEGIGYYRFDAASHEKVPDMYDYELWSGALTLGDGEIAEMEDLFINGKYPVLSQSITDTYSYILYQKNGSIYLIVINHQWDQETPVEIPLASLDGTVKIGDFTASIEKGIGFGGTVSGSGVFKATLAKSEAAKYKLTLSRPVSTDNIRPMTYRDLGRHPWARTQIEELKEKGIVNDTSDSAYRPGDNITRADFAGFLIRTMGLSADTDAANSFSDVNPDSEFAKEIAVGKALGILNGIGDGRYAPLATITRQDMMTIIARAMRLSDDAFDISGYTDSGEIADYALSGVKAMMRAGLIVGNADGTINPHGSTTRAEAAVLMYRILHN